MTLLKEAKLFSDYDIKVKNMQTSKIDYYKNLSSSIEIGLRQLLNCYPLFLHELIREIERSTNIQDIYVVRLLQLGYDFKSE